MPKLIIMNDQTGATGKEEILFDNGISATDVLMANFSDGIDPENTKIYVRSQEMQLGDNPDIRLVDPLFNNDTIIVINEAKGLTAIQWFYVALVAAAVSIALAPSIPGNAGTQKDSPNNNLQAQTNIARPYQAYPLIFGSPRVYPDLTGEPIVEYISNVKIVTQLMNVGVGLFDITETRAGNTKLSNFTGSSATFFEPVSRVVTVPSVTNVFETNEIDGQLVLAVNDGTNGTVHNLVENGTNLTTFNGTTFIFQVDQDTNSDALKTAFDAAIIDFVVEVDYNGDIDGFSGPQALSGTGTVTTMNLSASVYTITVLRFTGPKTFDNSSYSGPFVVTEKSGISLGPIALTAFADEIWVNFNFLKGLKGTVNLRVQMQQLTGQGGSPIIGPQEAFLVTYTENTFDQQFRTFKNPLGSPGWYTFTISRTDTTPDDSNKPDETAVEAVFAVTKDTNSTFDNNTLVEIVVPATINATSLRQNQINLSLTSKLITYDGVNVVTVPAASRKAADALLHLYSDFFGLDSNTLALDELYEIQNRIDLIDPRLATFDFTFDDIDVSLDERMDAILNVMRCYKWLDGDVYRFARDEERANESTVITRRDIVTDDQRDYSMSYNPQLLENYDSVKVQYVDSVTNKKAYIFRKLDSLGVVVDGAGNNPKTMELAGSSESFNAINRAELEIRKLVFQRWTLTDTMLTSGMLLDKGDMVLYAEQYTSDLFDGEIMAINGNIATTSESIDFSVGTLFLHYMLDDGTAVGPFSISEVIGESNKFSSTDLGQAFLRDSELGFDVQTGSRYIIGQTVDLDASRWTVIEKEARGESVNITMTTYDERVYDFD